MHCQRVRKQKSEAVRCVTRRREVGAAITESARMVGMVGMAATDERRRGVQSWHRDVLACVHRTTLLLHGVWGMAACRC